MDRRIKRGTSIDGDTNDEYAEMAGASFGNGNEEHRTTISSVPPQVFFPCSWQLSKLEWKLQECATSSALVSSNKGIATSNKLVANSY